MILVVCALFEELSGFARDGVRVVAVGVGPVEAAAETARVLASTHPRCVVNAGIGGGFRGRAQVGDAVLVREEHYVELGREDDEPLTLPGGRELERVAASDDALIAAYVDGVPDARIGDGVTSATITTSDARAAFLDARYAPAVESMEGFAVLRAAALAGVPAVEVRGISNLVGDRAKSGWNFRAGSIAAVHALTTLLDRLALTL
jgi:futalosine hydrolase